MTRSCVFILLWLLLISFPANADQRVALVIGNGAYKDAPLANPANDAADMAAKLKHFGFTVIHLENAGLRTMEGAIAQFGNLLKNGGVGLFYYAGHGIQVAGRNYLVPTDAKVQTESEVRYECVDAGRILGWMQDAGNRLNIIILDACRNNPFARNFRSAEQGLARMDAPTGSLVSYATAPGMVASDGEDRNGIFTKHLLRNMDTRGLDIIGILMRTRQAVLNETNNRQVPWESSSLTGYFYFQETPEDGMPPAPPSTAPAPTAALVPSPAPGPVQAGPWETLPFTDTFDAWQHDLWIQSIPSNYNYTRGRVNVKNGALILRIDEGAPKSWAGIRSGFAFWGDFDVEVSLYYPFAASTRMNQNCYIWMIGGKERTGLVVRKNKTDRSVHVEWNKEKTRKKDSLRGFHDGFNGRFRLIRTGNEITYKYRRHDMDHWKKIVTRPLSAKSFKLFLGLTNAYLEDRPSSVVTNRPMEVRIDDIIIHSAHDIERK